MNSQETGTPDRNDPVEAVLRRAKPRPVPPLADERAIRNAVQAEWRSVVRERQSRQRLGYFAIAASVLVAFSALVMTLRTTSVPSVEVARINKSAGTVYRLGERSELIKVSDVGPIQSGQVIVTGQDAALGLDWSEGGSLRVDAATRIEFVDASSVFLHEGRIYFDSDDGTAELIIDTAYGSVTHLGTQYMAETDRDGLRVSVRAGRVAIDGRYHDQVVGTGKQVDMRGSARPVVVDLSPHSPAWAWTEPMAPGIDLTNRSADEFLQWVGRQTGYDITYASPDAEALASATRLVGRVETDPRTELRLRMLTTDLDYSFDEDSGAISVAVIDNDGP